MKRHSSVLGAIALFLFGLCPVFAHAGCAISTIVGTYGYSATGYNVTHPGTPTPHVLALAGTYTFNGDGTVNRAFTISFEGVIQSATDSGTYTVNADCSGTMAFNVYFGLETYNLTIVGGGNAIHFINSTTGIVLAGRMEKQ